MTYPLSAIQDLAAERKSALATGPFGSSIGRKTFQDHGVPVIRGSNLSEAVGLRLNDSGLVFIDPSLADKFSRSKAVRGDLVFTCWGTVNQVGLIDECSEYEEYIVSNKQMKLSSDPEKADPLFLYYYFSSPLGQQAIADNTIGSSVPGFNLTALKSIRVPNPPLEVQRGISQLLGSLDDKIELNRRMNETLEEMARALFRDWFVDFGPTRRQMEGATDPAAIMGHAFPPEKAATLAPLFPAKLGDDGLPEGWEERPLDEIGHFLNGLALQKFPAQDGKSDLPVIKIAELRNGVTAKSNRASTDVPDKYVIGNGDFIFSWSGSLIAKFWTGGAGALNQHLFKVTSESHPMWFVSEWVQTHLEEFQRIAASKAVTMGHIKRSHLAEAMCVCPDDDALTVFGEIFNPLISKQIANDEENQTLAEMRDLLLPKLMSGEICLKDTGAEV
ncbi:restriction endonuclease subunit S [Tritonibacter sp. SIMBA_163]|uniref:restriction endonuclease subunit S n=1 Tax=Tritonibacter sp. SIMBA_163 TaxID=3080868 RepID=UPI00397FAF32